MKIKTTEQFIAAISTLAGARDYGRAIFAESIRAAMPLAVRLYVEAAVVTAFKPTTRSVLAFADASAAVMQTPLTVAQENVLRDVHLLTTRIIAIRVENRRLAKFRAALTRATVANDMAA